MPLLENFVHGDQGFERLDLVCKDGLPRWQDRGCQRKDLRIDSRIVLNAVTYTFMPAQKDCDDL